jgi:hypothetical protein
MIDTATTQQEVSAKVAAIIDFGLDFVLVYDSIIAGEVIYHGTNMTQPVPGSILFDYWDDGAWQTTDLIYLGSILAIYHTEDDCPHCDRAFIDLDTWNGETAMCVYCWREEGELLRAEGLRADGGLI